MAAAQSPVRFCLFSNLIIITFYKVLKPQKVSICMQMGRGSVYNSVCHHTVIKNKLSNKLSVWDEDISEDFALLINQSMTHVI